MSSPTDDPPVVETPPVTDPPPSQPWHSEIFSQDGKFVDAWQSKLPSDLEPYKGTLANFKDMGSLAKALHDNMTVARSKPAGITIPGETATEEEKKVFQSALAKHWGVPDAPDAYKFQKPDSMPEGISYDEALAENFKADAHKLGLTQAQADGILQLYQSKLGTQVASVQTAQAELLKSESEQMKTMWGDKVNDTLTTAARVALTLNLPEAKALMDPSSNKFVGPVVAGAFAQMAQHLGEAKLVGVAAASNMDSATMASDIINNPANPDYEPFRNASHPRSAEVRARVNKLFSQ